MTSQHHVSTSGPVIDPRADALRARYLAQFGGVDIPVPIEAIAEDLLGLRVTEDADLDCSGVLLPTHREILLNRREARESPGRRQFTLAHELGHWVCQVLEGHTAPIYCRAEDVGLRNRRHPIEREANVFAAELLMPESLVRKRFGPDSRISSMATDFGVSVEAMHWRLYNFGLMPIASSHREPSE